MMNFSNYLGENTVLWLGLNWSKETKAGVQHKESIQKLKVTNRPTEDYRPLHEESSKKDIQ
ncbi:hypothetical protein [Methyloglobulus sp.]|uniref:hypothetical protein n=1 Tax=Methyloglobulus sp. TaxID=2518622 RepID=UPI0032B83B50